MPKLTERASILNQIDEGMKFAALDSILRDDEVDSELDSLGSSSDEEEDSTYETLATMHMLVSESIFINVRRRLPKSRDYVLNHFLDQNDDCFHKITRVHRATFYYIISLIESHLVFHNRSTCEQAPVHWQLACALDRLGNDGQGVSHAHSKLIWGIGQGTVHLYTNRVITALFSLRDRFIFWPNAAGRDQISRRMERKGFKNLVGFVDGTTIPIHKKPAVFGNIFMDRKKRYFVNAQVACDDQNKITFFMSGHPGSSGDSRVFSVSNIIQRPDLAFSEGQYLLTDSAYGALVNIVSAYKERQQDCRTDADEPRKIQIFNTLLAKARVVNKHTIGILKARWTSMHMQGMRVDIHKKEDMKNFVEQATVCAVLHNICLHRDSWEEEYVEEGEEIDVDEEIQESRRSRTLTPGQRKWWEVRTACLRYHGIA